MKRRVVSIAIDAASTELLDAWIAAGHLPALASLRERSARADLRGGDAYRAETPLTCFLTGCEPEQTGYWTLLRFSPSDYAIHDIGAYDFNEYPPFYALGSDYRVIAFDLPHSRPLAGIDGLQVASWGSHSPLAPRESRPAPLLAELESRFGVHPALLRDEATPWRRNELERLEERLLVGLDRRVDICAHLLKDEPWDLFLTAFGETHAAGHYLWHLSQDDHPLSRLCRSAGKDPLLRVFQAVDRGIERLRTSVPEETYFVVFAQEGMEANCMDLPSMVFLPELLYRIAFGRTGLGAANGPLGEVELPARTWVPAVWNTQSLASPLRRFIRAQLPSALSYRIDRLWRSDELEPLRPADSGALPYQPAMWFRHLWPRMQAFALPSFAEGYIRVNVRGRETSGVVDPQDYDRVCDQLTAEITALKDARSGEPMVHAVRRTRRTALDNSPKLPDADLIVLWRSTPTDTVESPTRGRIGPIPFYRAGSHTERGFVWIAGPGIRGGAQLAAGRPTSVAPTLLALLGAKIPDYMKQPPLLTV